jgi:hypothetical protein
MTARKARESSVKAPTANTAVTHTIELDPIDWYIATWRKLPPLPRPEPAPFQQKDCLARAQRVIGSTYSWGWNWSRANVPLTMTPEEARFWFEAMTFAPGTSKPTEAAAALEQQDLSAPLTLNDVVARLSKYQGTPVEMIKPLVSLLSPAGVAELLLRPDLLAGHSGAWQMISLRLQLLRGVRQFLVPYLEPAERQAMREVVAAHPRSSVAPPQGSNESAIQLAAALGMHAHVLDFIAACPDGLGSRSSRDESIYWVVFGLGSAELVNHHLRRLALPVWREDFMRAWLAHTDLSGLDVVRDAILAAARSAAQTALMRCFCRIKAPEAAPHMLQLKLHSKASALARQWLEDEVGNAVAGLVPLVTGGKLAEPALDYLRQVKARGLGAVIEEQLAHASPEAAEKVCQEVLEGSNLPFPALDESSPPEWLRDGAETNGKPAKMPGWAHPAALPPLVVGDHCLYPKHVETVLRALQKSTLAAPSPIIQKLREHVDPQRLDAFAWKLFELWQLEGGVPKEKWAIQAVGHLGGDAAAMRLAPLVREWPGQSLNSRALLGLECLRKIGTDTALMQLNAIAQKVKFKSLKAKAQTFMMEIATERGLSPAQLEDRIVPDLDLDEKGGRVFDFGPRQFRFVLGPDLKPLVRHPDGKLKGELPKPGAKDEQEKAKAAVDAWKLLKKQVREVVRFQAQRLEEAMCSLRRWRPSDFEAYLVRHPLMINLVRRVLWGGYDEKRQLLRTFRVTEDATYADVEDRTCTLEGLPLVGVVHPLHLSEEQRAAWGQVLGDYEIIAPFAQLARRVHVLQPGEETAKELTRFGEGSVEAMIFSGILKSHRWDGGGYYHQSGYYKTYPAAEVTACLDTDSDGSSVRIKRAYFLPLGQSGVEWALKLGEVDPVVMSEVLGSLLVVASKAT